MSSTSDIRELTAHEEWQKLIDRRLADWQRNPSQLADDELPAPSSETVRLAIQVAECLRDRGTLPPTRIVPDAHAGIVFEREVGRLFESYRISANGEVEFCIFEDCRLVQRTPLSLIDN